VQWAINKNEHGSLVTYQSSRSNCREGPNTGEVDAKLSHRGPTARDRAWGLACLVPIDPSTWMSALGYLD
jgi:hypothetical protein